MMEYTFYQIECNGKVYVGQTIDITRRIYYHKYYCYTDKSKHYNVPLYQYIRANGGWNNCQFTILEKCNFQTKRDAEMREEYWRIEKEATLNSHRCFTPKKQKQMEYNEHRRKLRQLNPNLIKQKESKHCLVKKIRRRQKRLKEKMLIELKEKISSL
jgi:hypothetical protein